jgi:allophanate hydrolase subunit 2
MSIDTDKLHKLKGKGFFELYSLNPAKWKEMVDNAATYAKSCVGEGEAVKDGDVISVVENAIKISKDFENHLTKKKLTQKYWIRWFAEYIVDIIYPHPEIKIETPK